MEETQQRFFTFIEKLELRMQEFTDAAIPELTALNCDSADKFKQGFHRMKSGVIGQLNSIRQKANEVFEEKVQNANAAGFTANNVFYDFKNACSERMRQFENLYHQYHDKINATEHEDYEKAYQKIIDEFNDIKNKFTCVQCGAAVVIDKMYFTTTYIACSFCHTQNTYEPSSQAKQLEHTGRSLAEQRTAHLLTEYNQLPAQIQQLYQQQHELKLSLVHESNNKIIAEKNEMIAALQQQQQALENKKPLLYETYLRAMFTEWNKINPAMQAEHEKFLERLLNDYKKYK